MARTMQTKRKPGSKRKMSAYNKFVKKNWNKVSGDRQTKFRRIADMWNSGHHQSGGSVQRRQHAKSYRQHPSKAHKASRGTKKRRVASTKRRVHRGRGLSAIPMRGGAFVLNPLGASNQLS